MNNYPSKFIPKSKIELKHNYNKVKSPQYFGKLPHDLYPYWYIKLTNPQTEETFDWNPSFPEFLNILKKIFAHEKILDSIMGRNSEFQKWYKFANNVCDIAKNNRLLQEYDQELKNVGDKQNSLL